MTTHRPSRAALLVAITTLLSGCLTRDLTPLVPCTVSGAVYKVKVNNVEQVDVLFVIDNSGSMSQEQEALRSQIPRLVRVLTTGDLSGDAQPEFPAVADLHVGVVSTDIGVGQLGAGTPNSCDAIGDDGVLQTTSSVGSCAGTFAPVHEFRREGGNAESFANGVGCVAALGTQGCGFEQQLEATLKAVTPSTTNLTFFGNTRGQADLANAGFIRPNSLLAVILLTDEEDCSTTNAELFNNSSAAFPGNLNMRCITYDETLHATQRYVDGLLALRPDHHDLVVFAAIVGVPPQLVNGTTAIDYDAILADPAMDYRVDSSGESCPDVNGNPQPGQCLLASCRTPTGRADPPRRIVEVAKGLQAAGASTIVQSICQEDFRPALDKILEKIADALSGTCLGRPLNPRADGTVPCNVVETLPLTGDITRCDQLAAQGRSGLRTEADGAQTCEVTQVRASRAAPATEPGWFYDTFSDDVLRRCATAPQRVSFTTGAEPISGATVRIECLQNVAGNAGEIGIGSPCADDGVCGQSAMRGLICEGASRICQVACANDADCPGGLVCDPSAERHVCRSATCPN